MAYLKSDKVRVYPSAYRGQTSDGKLYNPESRLQTEFNLTSANNNNFYRKSYVINWDSTNKILTCIIQGYYFRLDLTDYPFESTLELYAHIQLFEKNPTGTAITDYTALSLSNYEEPTNDSLDISEEFKGIMLDDTIGTNGFLLLKRDSATSAWYIPKSSKLKINVSDISNGEVSPDPIDDEFTTKKLQVNGTAEVTDVLSAKKGLNVTGDDLVVGEDKFLVNTDGDTTINGTLTTNEIVNINKGVNVSGANFTVDTDKFIIDYSNGDTTINGKLTQGTTSKEQVTFNGNIDANDGLDIIEGEFIVGDNRFVVDNDGTTTIKATLYANEGIDCGSKNILNLFKPTNGTDAANKTYVDDTAYPIGSIYVNCNNDDKPSFGVWEQLSTVAECGVSQWKRKS